MKDSRRRTVSMRDIAERAGVSVATVSHVLRKTRKVNQETRQRVLGVSRELGYEASDADREGVGFRPTHVLGLVVSDIQDPFFTESVKGFEDQAWLHHMEPVIMNTNYDPLRAVSSIRRLIRIGVSGVAVLATEPHGAIIDHLTANDICAVYIDAGRVGPYVASLNLDYAHGIRQAVRHLRALGHRRLGYIGSLLDQEAIRVRRQAFLEELGDAEGEVVEAAGTVEGGYYIAGKLFSRSSPTAIVCSSDLLAIGALHYAADQGIQVPDQLSIVGFDNIDFARFTMPELTTVGIPKYECGRLAFQVLNEMIQDPAHIGREVTVQPQLVLRQSTAPCPEDPLAQPAGTGAETDPMI